MFANTPEPPYYAVIFTSQISGNMDGYADMADKIGKLAATMPGFLGMESVRGAEGVGITVAYYDSLEAIDGWRKNADHMEAKGMGREMWYDGYRLRIAKVETAKAFDR